MVTSSAEADGPDGLADNLPCGEFERILTTRGAPVVARSPEPVTRAMPMGGDGAPAVIGCCGIVNPSAACVQARKER